MLKEEGEEKKRTTRTRTISTITTTRARTRTTIPRLLLHQILRYEQEQGLLLWRELSSLATTTIYKNTTTTTTTTTNTRTRTTTTTNLAYFPLSRSEEPILFFQQAFVFFRPILEPVEELDLEQPFPFS